MFCLFSSTPRSPVPLSERHETGVAPCRTGDPASTGSSRGEQWPPPKKGHNLRTVHRAPCTITRENRSPSKPLFLVKKKTRSKQKKPSAQLGFKTPLVR